MSGRSQRVFLTAGEGRLGGRCSLAPPVVVRASVSPVPELAPERGGRHGNKSAAGASAGCARRPHSNRGGHRSRKKNLIEMTLAALAASGFSFLPSLLPLPVAATLSLALLLALGGLAIAPPCLPLPPAAGLLAAGLTAITRQRLLGPEDPLATLQQTNPAARIASPPPAPLLAGSFWGVLIFGRS